ncbi:hypothetical protein [Sulfurimonas sp. HSL3-2]|uniref:hypothetical protein n=1 Tax=Hydrocurvibacter mobilis TaxID=3131936 RepID=UPI0031F88137
MNRYLNKNIIIVLALYLFSTLLYADTNKLSGAWQCNDNYGNRSSLKFLSKNLLEYDREQMNYRTTKGIIKIPNDYGIEEDYPYTFKKKSLTIIFPDMTQIVCRKIVHSPKKAKTSSHTGGSFIIGPLCSWSGSSSSYSGSSYSSSKRVYFNGNNFSLSSESSFSSSAGNAYSQGGNPSQSGTYTIEGNSVVFRFQDGSSTRMSIKIRQNSGEITELMFGQKLFAKSLCN